MKTMPELGQKIWYINAYGRKVKLVIDVNHLVGGQPGHLRLPELTYGSQHYSAIVGAFVKKVKVDQREYWYHPEIEDKSSRYSTTVNDIVLDFLSTLPESNEAFLRKKKPAHSTGWFRITISQPEILT